MATHLLLRKPPGISFLPEISLLAVTAVVAVARRGSGPSSKALLIVLLSGVLTAIIIMPNMPLFCRPVLLAMWAMLAMWTKSTVQSRAENDPVMVEGSFIWPVSRAVSWEKRKLHTNTWTPSGQVKALVFICHGYGERLSPYYDSVGEAGASKGLLCFGHDHTGHGKSEGERVQVSSMDELVEPVLVHCKAMSKKHPGLPLFIVGHSMGGLISLLAALSTKDPSLQFQGMVLVGPLIEIDPALSSDPMKFLGMVASKVWTSFSLTGIDVKMVTRNKDWQERKTSDALHYHGGAKALMGYVLIQAVDSLTAQLSKIRLPLLIMHGEEDKICSPGGSEALLRKAGGWDKTLEVIHGGMHNLYLEPEPMGTTIRDTSLNWIVARI